MNCTMFKANAPLGLLFKIIFLFQKPVDALIRELKAFIPHEYFSGMYSLASSYFHFHILVCFFLTMLVEARLHSHSNCNTHTT